MQYAIYLIFISALNVVHSPVTVHFILGFNVILYLAHCIILLMKLEAYMTFIPFLLHKNFTFFWENKRKKKREVILNFTTKNLQRKVK